MQATGGNWLRERRRNLLTDQVGLQPDSGLGSGPDQLTTRHLWQSEPWTTEGKERRWQQTGSQN